MKKLETQKKKIAIVGFGVSGKAACRYFMKEGVHVDVYEDKGPSEYDMTTISEFEAQSLFALYLGAQDLSFEPSQYDFVIASPGVPMTHHIIKEALDSGSIVMTDINVFLKIFRAKYPRGRVISITGSNGKSTTVSLMYDVLRAAGIDVYLGGNIGISPLDFFDHIQTDSPVVILETSSYQLEYLSDEDYFDIAGITNISDNHLNRYEGRKDLYAQAKLGGINSTVTQVIVNLDDQDSLKYVVPHLKTKQVLAVHFESGFADNIISLENNSLVYRTAGEQHVYVPDVTAMKIRGMHNIYNAAYVVAVCVLLDIHMTPQIHQALYDFGGLIHRIQIVDTIRGVVYINDSKSTSPDATQKALETVGSTKNIILISGGNDKDISYESMAEGWREYVKQLILLPGSANTKLKEMAGRTGVEILGEVKTMEDAFDVATTASSERDIVLLSPATDSHASFKSFEDRGNQFIQCVQNSKN